MTKSKRSSSRRIVTRFHELFCTTRNLPQRSKPGSRVDWIQPRHELRLGAEVVPEVGDAPWTVEGVSVDLDVLESLGAVRDERGPPGRQREVRDALGRARAPDDQAHQSTQVADVGPEVASGVLKTKADENDTTS